MCPTAHSKKISKFCTKIYVHVLWRLLAPTVDYLLFILYNVKYLNTYNVRTHVPHTFIHHMVFDFKMQSSKSS